jgi:hypothetical protein
LGFGRSFGGERLSTFRQAGAEESVELEADGASDDSDWIESVPSIANSSCVFDVSWLGTWHFWGIGGG